MNEEKKQTIEEIERYLFLIKSLEEDNMLEKIDEKYIDYNNKIEKENEKQINLTR